MLDGWTIVGSHGSRTHPAALDLGPDVAVGEQHGHEGTRRRLFAAVRAGRTGWVC